MKLIICCRKFCRRLPSIYLTQVQKSKRSIWNGPIACQPWQNHLNTLWGMTLQDAAKFHGKNMCPYSLAYAKASLTRTPREIIDANTLAAGAFQLARVMENFDILVVQRMRQQMSSRLRLPSNLIKLMGSTHRWRGQAMAHFAI